MKTLYIAEKPDIAKSMAAYLWPQEYQRLKDKHCFRKGDVTVTWSFGHILMTAQPSAYGEQFKSFSCYPIFPKEWKKLPSPAAKEQYDFIKKELKGTDIVINGGDPDREGQLLVDEILDLVGYKGTTNRILINAKDEASMKRAFDNIVPNSRYRNLYLAGLARERADWLVGMNLSRAYSVNAQKQGKCSVMRIGRVKIPTLSLVVAREREIENFHSTDYFVLVAKHSKNGVPFTATLQPKEDAPMDCDNRILDKKYVEHIYNMVSGMNCKVISVERKSGTESAPLPYSLDTLQVEANRRFGMSPASVLNTVQNLYERKYVSYPRSDCNYIPTSQHSDAGRILKSLNNSGLDAACCADANIKGKAFNDGKVSAHHAIIPTGVTPKDLNEWEQKIYTMIALRYIVQFFPPCKFDTVKYTIECQGHIFTGSGKVVTSQGWKSVIKGNDSEDLEESSPSLPQISQGDILVNGEYEIECKQTKPPKRFTEGTLLAAMTNIWRFVCSDNPNKEKLKECKGIGTPATRDTIISELLASSSGKSEITPCLRKEGKGLVPTEFGCCLIDNIDQTLTKPDFTAEMEYNLSAIADGKMSMDDFMSDMEKLVKDNIDYAEHKNYVLPSMAGGKDAAIEAAECPVCHKKTLERKYSPKTKSHFWICSDKDCVHPVTGKQIFFEDKRNKPVIKNCPDCKTILSRIYSKKTGKYYWFCPKCEKFINEDDKKSKKGK